MLWECGHLDEILHHPDGLTTQWIVSLALDCHGSFPLDRALALSHQYQYRRTITVLSIEVYGHTIMTTNRLASLVAVPNRHELRHRLYFCQCYHPNSYSFRIGVMAGNCKRFPLLVFQVSHFAVRCWFIL